MLSHWLQRVNPVKRPLPAAAHDGTVPLPPETQDYLKRAYPGNHNYRIVRGRLVPSWKLVTRYNQLSRHYPQPLKSVLDLSCSKGYFVLAALADPTCQRAMGIDVVAESLEVCRSATRHLGCGARFEQLYLHELAARIDEFGGPFNTSLLVNTYQYMYLGGVRDSFCYDTHDEIFRLLREVTCGRLIFNNRTQLSDCQRDLRTLAEELGKAEEYRTDAVLAAAKKYFHLRYESTLGRYPLWVLEAR